MLLIRINTEIRKRFDIQLSVKNLLGHQTIEELSGLIDSLQWLRSKSALEAGEFAEETTV